MITLVLVEVVVFGVLLAADLVSKHFIMPYLEAHGNVVLIDKVLTLTPAYNEGAGFSMLSGKTGVLIALTVVGLVAILAITVYAHIKLDTRRKSTRFLMVVLMMMLSGGLGNLIDRIKFGYVRDFIDYTVIQTLFHRSFAICNVADIWLTVGMVLLLVYVIFFMKDADKKEENAPAISTDTRMVAEANRLMAAEKARQVDERQVIFRVEEETSSEAASTEDAAEQTSGVEKEVDRQRQAATPAEGAHDDKDEA